MPKVIIYTTPTCPYCVTLKKYLTEKGIEFEHLDVASNNEAREDMIKKCNCMSVPVVDIDGKIIMGFDKEKIDKLLNL